MTGGHTLTHDEATDMRDLLNRALADGHQVTLSVTAEYAEQVFEVGDRVTIYGDDGQPMKAEILQVDTRQHTLRVKYQGRFTTWLPRSSVTTHHIVLRPSSFSVTTQAPVGAS